MLWHHIWLAWRLPLFVACLFAAVLVLLPYEGHSWQPFLPRSPGEHQRIFERHLSRREKRASGPHVPFGPLPRAGDSASLFGLCVAGPHPYWPPHWPSPMPFPWPFGPAAPTPPHLPPSAHRHHGHPHLRFDSPPPPPWYWPAAPPPPPDPRADVAVLSAALIAIALLLVCALIARPFVKVALDAFESYLESSQELLGDSMGDSMGERSLSGWARAKRRALLALAAANHRLRRICMICMPLEGAPHRSGWSKLDEDLESGAGRWRMGSAAPCGGRDGRFASRSARTAAPALSTGASTSTGPNVVVDSTNAAARAGLAAARSAAAPAGALRRAKPFGAQRQWPLTARSPPPQGEETGGASATAADALAATAEAAAPAAPAAAERGAVGESACAQCATAAQQVPTPAASTAPTADAPTPQDARPPIQGWSAEELEQHQLVERQRVARAAARRRLEAARGQRTPETAGEGVRRSSGEGNPQGDPTGSPTSSPPSYALPEATPRPNAPPSAGANGTNLETNLEEDQRNLDVEIAHAKRVMARSLATLDRLTQPPPGEDRQREETAEADVESSLRWRAERARAQQMLLRADRLASDLEARRDAAAEQQALLSAPQWTPQAAQALEEWNEQQAESSARRPRRWFRLR